MQSLDNTIEYHHLLLKIDLKNLPKYDLPKGYSFAFYQDGDEKYWKEIEVSSQDCFDEEEAQHAWNEYYQSHKNELYNRLIFVINNQTKEKVATATSYYNTWTNDRKEAYLHWVAVKKEYQGKKLSKPLISFAFQQLILLGYQQAFISTQTTSWLAAKIYLDFQAYPFDLEKELRGFQVLKAIIGKHPMLNKIDAAPCYYDSLKVKIKTLLYQKHPDIVAFKMIEVQDDLYVKVRTSWYIFEYKVEKEKNEIKSLYLINNLLK